MLEWLDRGFTRVFAAPVWAVRVMLAVLALALFLPLQQGLPVTDRDEARFAQASRQMVASGDAIDIRFQDTPRHKKPVGIYWMQSAAALITGDGAGAAIGTFRRPSLIGAVVAVVLVHVMALPLVGPGAAALAAVIMAGSLVLMGEARIAKTDAVLLALILTAQAVLARLWAGPAPGPKWGRGAALVFWTALGMGVLVKGPVAPLFVGLALLAGIALRRGAGWLRPLAWWPAVIIGALIFLPWLVAIGWQTRGAFFAASLGEDMMAKVQSGVEAKGAPPGTYLALLWLAFWPGATVIPAALPALWRARGHKAVPLLLAAIVPVWLIFEAVPTKLFHYLMPAYPALAILIALGLTEADRPSGAGRWIGAPLLLIGPAVPLAAGWLAWDTGAPGRLGLAALALGAGAASLGLALMLWRALARDLRALAVALLPAMSAASLIPALAVLSATPWLWPSAELTARARALLPDCPAPRITAVGYNEPSLVFLAGIDTHVGAPAQALETLPLGPCSLIAIEARALETTLAHTTARGLAEAGLIEGYAIGGGRQVSLTLYLHDR